MFFYKEELFYVEKALHKGKLNTNNTPSHWGELMNPHFIPWDNVDKDHEMWKDGKLILSYDYETGCYVRI